MQIEVSGQNLAMTKALKEYAQKKIGKIEHYFAEAVENGKVEMAYHHTKSPEKSNEAKVMVFAHGAILTAREENEDMYAAIDLLFEKLERQLKKYKTRIKNHKREKVSVALSEIYNHIGDEEADSSDRDVPIIYTTKQTFKPMSVEEAMMQLQLNNMAFIFFKNADSQDMNVLYQRKDGDFGLIEPQF